MNLDLNLFGSIVSCRAVGMIPAEGCFVDDGSVNGIGTDSGGVGNRNVGVSTVHRFGNDVVAVVFVKIEDQLVGVSGVVGAEGVVVDPRDNDIELIVAIVDQIPFGAARIRIRVIPIAEIAPLSGLCLGVNGTCEEVITLSELVAADRNRNVNEFHPKRGALDILDSVILDQLLAVVVGSGKGDLELNDITDVCKVTFGLAAVEDNLIKVRAGDLVFVDDGDVGHIGGDGNGRGYASVNKIIAGGKIVENNGIALRENRFIGGSCCSKSVKICDHVFVRRGALLGNCAGIGIIVKVIVLSRAEHSIKELVGGIDSIGYDGVAVRIKEGLTLAVSGIGCVKELIKIVGLTVGGVGDGNRTGFCSEGSNADRKKHSQHEHNGK